MLLHMYMIKCITEDIIETQDNVSPACVFLQLCRLVNPPTIRTRSVTSSAVRYVGNADILSVQAGTDC